MIARVLRWSLVLLATPLAAQQTKRPMTFLDVQEMRTATPPAVSLDGRWGLYSVSTPDWRADRRQSDLYLVSMSGGVPPHPPRRRRGARGRAAGARAADGAAAGPRPRAAPGTSSTTCDPTAARHSASPRGPAAASARCRAAGGGLC